MCRSLVAAGSEESYFCASTLPAQYASVARPESRCMRKPPPPPLPDGEPGFTPKVQAQSWQLLTACCVNCLLMSMHLPPCWPRPPEFELSSVAGCASCICCANPSRQRRQTPSNFQYNVLCVAPGPGKLGLDIGVVILKRPQGFSCCLQLFPGTGTGPSDRPAGFATLKTLQVTAQVTLCRVTLPTMSDW